MNKCIDELFKEYLIYISSREKITNVHHKNEVYNCYIKKYFYDVKLCEIDENIFLNWQYKISKLNLSENTISNIHTCIKRFFDYLNLMYNVPNLPLKFGKIKGIDLQHEYKTFSHSEYKQFIKHVDNKIYHALFNTLYYTGLRKSEILALKVSDLNDSIIDSYLNVNKTITRNLYDGKHLILEPKTKKSIRKVHIDIFLFFELKQLITYYNKTYQNFNNNFYLFGGNKPLSSTSLDRYKNYYCDKAHVKRITIHEFRHTHATMLNKLNIRAKLIQERLGHSDISTTMNVYIHENESENKKLINKISLLHF